MGDADEQTAVVPYEEATAEQLATMEPVLMEVLDGARRYVRMHAESEHEAEDVLQDIASELWQQFTRGPKAFLIPDSPKAVGLTVARNHMVDCLRRDSRWDEVIVPDIDLDTVEVPSERDAPDGAPLDSLPQRVEALSDEMPKRMRACWWGWYHKRTNADLARELGITEKTVRNQIGRGNVFLADRLKLKERGDNT